ncbi:ShlB/FhaC/HecB family hemolysin secretion/activation protein [Sideroxyarcus sp. TK5]
MKLRATLSRVVCILLVGMSPQVVAAVDDDTPPVLKFPIKQFVVDGAKLLAKSDFDQVVAPYVGAEKDFSDVQYALEAVEELYAERGYSAVHVLLPEQELEAGTVRFEVIESRFGKVEVKNNKFFSKANALYALPAVREGGVPRAKDIARQLRLANENPARQLNVVLKAGETDDEVNASVLVNDSNPKQWVVTLDNSGSKETGVSRLGVSFRDAGMFNRDHVGQMQMQISPQYVSRVKVLGGSYKIPLYTLGHSVEFFGGYSNINSLVGGLSNFQGGGLMFSSRYNIPLDRIGSFDPKLSLGLDWRKFSKIELTNPPPTVLYTDIVVTPLSVAYAIQGKLAKSDVNGNVSFTANMPIASKGKSADFAAYDLVNFSDPTPAYKVLRFGAGLFTQFGKDWQFRVAFDGQWSGDKLIQGEQMRLGGASGVRGFSEGSETGEQGAKFNIETYTPAWERGQMNARALVFLDGGNVNSSSANNSTSIASAGFGLRAGYGNNYGLRMDAGRILKEGNDPAQMNGDWRIHATLTGTF